MFKESTSIILTWVGIVLLFVTAVLFIFKGTPLTLSAQINESLFALFGDFVGGLIGSLWALAGVILFYVALTEQRKDFKTNQEVLRTQVGALEQQIKEFELQRVEMELSRQVYIEQATTLKKQQFESTFFNSLNLLNNIIENINITYPFQTSISGRWSDSDMSNRYYGRNSFEYFYEDLKQIYANKLITYNNGPTIKALEVQDEEFVIPIEDQRKLAIESYEELFEKHQSSLGHYFRTIYNVIKFINENEKQNPKYYTNLVRAQLSTFEHLLLFYNCLSKHGNEKFYPLIEKYSLLNNMPWKLLLNKEHKPFYNEIAYE